jgi:hypothetical protein
MAQLRELYGERLNDPQTVLELIVALSTPTTVGSPAASSSMTPSRLGNETAGS